MIKRKILDELKNHLQEKEISFIIGPRQAGKSTTMGLLKEHAEKLGYRTLLLNLDIETEKQFFDTQSHLIKKIQLEIGSNPEKSGVVFIDEIQRKKDAGVFLKGIYDMSLPYKFIVSGSGSVELKEYIHESLAGRKRIFEMPTVTFFEFFDFKTKYKYEEKRTEFFQIEKEKTENLLKEYMLFGGYPRVVTEERLEEKRKIMDDIYQSYLIKDISYLLNVKKTDSFSALVKLMAAQTGNMVNMREISRTLNLSFVSVKNYLWYLEKTFIIEKITPYFKNIRKEISKMPIYYFNDLGMRNYACGVFGNEEIFQTGDMGGFIFQNFIWNLLKENIKNTSAAIHFWRTKNGAEIDFLINTGQKIIPCEIKFKNLKKPEMTRGIQNYIEKYHPAKAFIINLSLEEKEKKGSTEIQFIPYYMADRIFKS